MTAPAIAGTAAGGIAVCLFLPKLNYRKYLLQNAAARTVMKWIFFFFLNHVTPILRQLHWLPIRKTPLSTSLIFSIYTPLLAFSYQHLDLSLMFPGPGIPRQSVTASEPSDMSLPPSGMSSPRASRRRTPFSLS